MCLGVSWDVGHIELPDGFYPKSLQWVKLQQLWGGRRGGVLVDSDLTRPVMSVRVVERLVSGLSERVSFWYSRDVAGPGKMTYLNCFGLVGLSRLNLRDRSVILTEGVSDYLSASMVFGDRNVLGLTSLGGNKAAHKIVCALFDSITYVSDNDMSGDINTGIRAAGRVMDFYRSMGKSVSVLLPAVGYKDFTEEFMGRLSARVL